MSWIATAPSGSLEDLLSLRPSLADRYFAFRNLVDDDHLVDEEVLGLCRLRIATMLGDRAGVELQAQSGGIPQQLVDSLPSWPTAPGFSKVARAALGVAEMFVIDSHGVTDGQVEELEAEIGAAGVVALTTALGLFDGECRMRLTLGDG